jgi:hypothetical protein
MIAIHITEEQATILDGADQAQSDPIARQLRKDCQAQANAIGKIVEIHHPDGYIWDVREPREGNA